MKTLAKVVLNISISIIIILLSVQVVTTKPYMMIHQGLHKSHDNITWDYEYASEQIIDYLNGKEDDLIFPSFEGGEDILMTERGLLHMEDVRVLFDNGRILLALFVVVGSIAGVYLWDKKEFYSSLRRLWIFPTVFVGTVTISMLINFSWTFTKFHELLFSNDLWLLRWDDPLIVMLPYMFFFTTAITIVIFIVLFHSGIIYLAYKKTPQE